MKLYLATLLLMMSIAATSAGTNEGAPVLVAQLVQEIGLGGLGTFHEVLAAAATRDRACAILDALFSRVVDRCIGSDAPTAHRCVYNTLPAIVGVMKEAGCIDGGDRLEHLNI